MKIIKYTTTTLLVLFVSFVLTGCIPTQAGYENVVKSWMNNDIDSLVSSWGPPSSTYKMSNGNTMYTWLNSGGTTIFPLTSNLGTTYHSSTSFCKTTFTADNNGQLVSWRFEGNSCRQ